MIIQFGQKEKKLKKPMILRFKKKSMQPIPPHAHLKLSKID